MADVKPYVPDPTNDYHAIQIADADRLSIPGGLLATSDLVVSGGAELTGLPATPTGDTAAVSYAALKDYINQRDGKDSVRCKTAAALSAYTASGSGVGKTLTSDANEALTIDGVSVEVGDRVLVDKEATSHVDHGVYTVTAAGAVDADWVLTRATDGDENDEVHAGNILWVEDGTAHEKQLWALTTKGDITVDTTALQYEQIGGESLYSGGDGISVSTSKVIAVDLATNPGLQFTSNKLDLLLNGGTLAKDASGVSVAGLPSLFQINSTAVSANVTAPNLDTLTGGTSSNADSLHTHTGATSVNVIKSLTAVEAITKGDPVEWSTTNDKIQKSRCDTKAKIDVFGIALADIAADAAGLVLTNGTAESLVVGGTAGDRYFLDDDGGIVQGSDGITQGNSIVYIGHLKNATDLEFRPQYLGQK